jgi:anti-sigma B factor antagonist
LASLRNLAVRVDGPVAVVMLPAEVDIANSGEITDLLLAVLNTNVATLVADMTATTFCACDGVSALVRAYLRAADNGSEVRVAARAPLVRRLFALTGVDRLIQVFDTVEAATAAPPPRCGSDPLRPARPGPRGAERIGAQRIGAQRRPAGRLRPGTEAAPGPPR